ncbi:MAG: NAD(P)-dependent oxidoreductase [Betaproteobacteria bacterium]|nr:NAD(P)-dependent oxidoreductase [Betaproteobacteria bacterium]
MTEKVGFIGLGNIGQPMAVQLARAGYDLMVYDVRKEPLAELAALGAKVALSPREVGAHADIIEFVVADDPQVEAAIIGTGGVLETAKPGTILAIHSTVLPSTIHKVAKIAAERGVIVIDAQISGGSTGAATGKLSYMVGGDETAFKRCRPLFEKCGDKIFHLGPLGAGAMTKLANNLIVYITRLAAAEGMRLAEIGGIDLKKFTEVVHASSGQSRVVDTWLNRVALRGGDTERPERLPNIIYKDLKLALEQGRELGLALPGGALAQQSLDKIV